MYEKAIKELTPNQWEFFAQDVLFHLGFNILTGPSEGTDDGLDMIVKYNDVKYLVSCKHNYKTRKNIGVRDEVDITDRIKQHHCTGFLIFYSTGVTTGLQKKLHSLNEREFPLIEIDKDKIFGIIPTMKGFTLQKYFSRPHELYHHTIIETSYKPLNCMKCNEDILTEKRMASSLAGFGFYNDELCFIFGCKGCVGDKITEDWIELTQARYVEQLLNWGEVIDEKLNSIPLLSMVQYKNVAHFYMRILQLQIPQGWGRWL